MADVDTHPTHIQAGPLRIALIPGPEGPGTEVGGELGGLDWILHHASESLDDGGINELFGATQSGAAYYHQIMFIRPLEPEDDLDAARETWRRITGTELDPEVFGELRYLCVASDGCIIPLGVLGDAVRQLKELRRIHRIDPPWLFLAESKWSHAHSSEREKLAALEQRLSTSSPPAIRDELAAAGLLSDQHAVAKYQTLLEGYPTLADFYAGRLVERNVQGLGPPPWLFRTGESPASRSEAGEPHVPWDLPHPAERLSLAALEAEAEAIDASEQALDGEPDPPDLLVRRRTFLRQLAEVGLLERWLHPRKKRWLAEWGFIALGKLQEAALQALDYLAGDERRRYNPDAEESAILSSPVCLDAFRGMSTPPGTSLFSWISWGEYLLRTHGPAHDAQAEQGVFPYHDQDGLIMVVWRKDAGLPALRHLSLRRPGGDVGG